MESYKVNPLNEIATDLNTPKRVVGVEKADREDKDSIPFSEILEMNIDELDIENPEG